MGREGIQQKQWDMCKSTHKMQTGSLAANSVLLCRCTVLLHLTAFMFQLIFSFKRSHRVWRRGKKREGDRNVMECEEL